MERHIVVIGSGPGGCAAALEAARPGVRVTIIERGEIGGVCLNHGCIPTKTWRTAAEEVERLLHSADFGLEAKDVRIDLERLATKKRSVISTLRTGLESNLLSRSVRIVRGKASPAGPGCIAVHNNEGVPAEMRYDALILALGSEPSGCQDLPFAPGLVLTPDDVLELRRLPRTALVVGAGANGCESASILAAFGVRVTIAELLPRLLPLETVDEDISTALAREMKKRGITVLAGNVVEGAGLVESGVRVLLETRRSNRRDSVEFTADIVIDATGRKPSTGSSGWRQIGIRMDDRVWVEVNGRMETNVPGVFAIGDTLGPSRPMLANVASMEGVVAAANALGGDVSAEYRAVPYAVFTSPEIAGVGLTETAARAIDPEIRARVCHFRALGKAQASGETDGFVKIVADGAGKVLGVHIIGSRASDLIAEGVLAVSAGATVADLAAVSRAHPTFAEAIGEAAKAFRK